MTTTPIRITISPKSYDPFGPPEPNFSTGSGHDTSDGHLVKWCWACGGRVLWRRGGQSYNATTGRSGHTYVWQCENTPKSRPEKSLERYHFGESIFNFHSGFIYEPARRWIESKEGVIDPWSKERAEVILSSSSPAPSDPEFRVGEIVVINDVQYRVDSVEWAVHGPEAHGKEDEVHEQCASYRLTPVV